MATTNNIDLATITSTKQIFGLLRANNIFKGLKYFPSEKYVLPVSCQPRL